MTVYAKSEQESFSTLLNRFKKKLKRSGTMEDYLESLVYVKPSVINNKKNSKKKRQKRYAKNHPQEIKGKNNE